MLLFGCCLLLTVLINTCRSCCCCPLRCCTACGLPKLPSQQYNPLITVFILVVLCEVVFVNVDVLFVAVMPAPQSGAQVSNRVIDSRLCWTAVARASFDGA